MMMQPKQWPLAAVPALVALLLIATVTVALMYLGFSLMPAQGGTEITQQLKHVALGFIVVIVALAGGVLAGLSLAQPLSGVALEALSARYEQSLGLAKSHDATSASVGLWRTVRVTLFALLFTVPALLLLTAVGLLFPPAVVITLPLKVAISAFAIAWDLLDYPLGTHGYGVRERVQFFRAHLGQVFGLGLTASLSLLIPGVGLLLLPIGVVGATDLAAALVSTRRQVG